MSTFNLNDCPKLGPYWLARVADGRVIPVTLAYDGDVIVGLWRGREARWYMNGQPNYSCVAPIHPSLVGPWSGKSIIGWTAEEMAELANKLLSYGYITMREVMQSMIDNRPSLPVWCPHVRLLDGVWRRFDEGGYGEQYSDPFCSKCGKPRPEAD